MSPASHTAILLTCDMETCQKFYSAAVSNFITDEMFSLLIIRSKSGNAVNIFRPTIVYIHRFQISWLTIYIAWIVGEVVNGAGYIYKSVNMFYLR